MNKAIAYIRVSTDRQAEEGHSLDAQAARITAYCIAHQLELVDVVREEGVSGTIPLAMRPAGARLLQRIGAEVQHIVIVKFDRMFRNTLDALSTIEYLDTKGTRLHALDFGGMPLDTSTAMGKLLVTLRAGFAQMEKELAAERVLETFAHKRARGQRIGQLPYGHSVINQQLKNGKLVGGDLVPHPQLPTVITSIRDMSHRGYSLRKIADLISSDFPELPISKGTVGTIIDRWEEVAGI